MQPIDATAKALKQELLSLKERLKRMAIDLTALTAELTNCQTVEGGAESLLATLTQEIATISAGSTDAATQTALNALVTTLQANDAALAAAIQANTPAAPTGAVGG